MSKKGVSAVSGVTSPTVGEKQTYNIVSWYPDTPASDRKPENVTWELFRKRRNGKFTTTNIKKKGISSFTFGEAAVGNTYRLEGYLHKPEGGGLIIIPKLSKTPRINKVELFYVDDKKGSVFNFTERLRARAYCVNMFNKELTFTLWEDDANGAGHNTGNKPIDTLKARVHKNGEAVVEFPLSRALMKKAMEGETDVRQLEFYVTVEYYKNKKHATENVDVNNPNPRIPINPPKKKEPKQPPKAKGSPADQKGKSKKEEKGVLDKIEEKWDELWDWWETSGTIKKEKSPTVQKTDKKTATNVGGDEKREKKEEKICECEARVRAFMRMLRKGEGTQGEKGYTTQYSGKQFSDLSSHPEEVITAGNYSSSAAGAYQVMRYTWWWLNGEKLTKSNKKAGIYEDDHNYIKKYNIKNFDQESQDEICVILFRHKQSKKFLDLIIENKPQEAMEKYGSYEWASLPPGQYGQPTQTMKGALAEYERCLKQELAGITNLHIKRGFLKKYGYNCCETSNDATSKNKEEKSTTAKNGYNIDKAIQKLNSNVEPKSLSKCAKYVRIAIEAGGLSTEGRPVSAKNYDKFLPKLGFSEISVANYVPVKGDISVIQSIDGHPHGHICMYNGKQWLSDFSQRDMWPGPSYRQKKPRYNIFRWK